MFVAALDNLHDLAIATWGRVLGGASEPAAAAAALLEYEADHLGEFRNYRIIFSALGDLDTPAIKAALRRMYRSFFRFLRDALTAARQRQVREPDADDAAWALIGIGTIATIAGELGLLSGRARGGLIARAGRALVAGAPATGSALRRR
jgi:hypothetical protein